MEERNRYFFIIIVILILFANCSPKIKAKPSQDSLTATEALRVIEEVRYAYENKQEKCS